MQSWDTDVGCRSTHRWGYLSTIKHESIILANLLHGEGLDEHYRSWRSEPFEYIVKGTNLSWKNLSTELFVQVTREAERSVIKFCDKAEAGLRGLQPNFLTSLVLLFQFKSKSPLVIIKIIEESCFIPTFWVIVDLRKDNQSVTGKIYQGQGHLRSPWVLTLPPPHPSATHLSENPGSATAFALRMSPTLSTSINFAFDWQVLLLVMATIMCFIRRIFH